MVVLLTTSCARQAALRGASPATNVRLAKLFGDHMVLQCDRPVAVWGWADPGGAVKVSIAGQRRTAVVDGNGKWMVKLRPLRAGGPYEMTVEGSDTRKLTNVMAGEVWVCSGQSNMVWWVRNGEFGVLNKDQEVASANHPNLRLFMVPNVTAFQPREDVEGEGWKVCSPETIGAFSGVAYFFGRALQAHFDVPIGLIQTAWGGTQAEAWTSRETLKALPEFAPLVADMDDAIPRIPELQKAYEEASAKWEAALDSHDAGLMNGQPLWAAFDLDTSHWSEMTLPTSWENAGYPKLDGFMWFRKEVDLPDRWAGSDAVLHLGPINDTDWTYFNGELVGQLPPGQLWNTPRVYQVPGALVREGRNVIVVRVRDIGNTGGICGVPEDLHLDQRSGAAPSVSLAGPWLCRVGCDLGTLPPRPAPPVFVDGNPNAPTVLYNAMVAPLIPYGIRGVIWYQGESNAQRAYQYRSLFPAMIRGWREAWGQGDFPFLFVQLANFMAVKPEPADDAWAELREAQLMTLSLPKTGMAVAIDIGEADNIHPANKQEVGARLALAARHVAYGENLVYSGPLFRKFSVEGSRVRLHFDHAGGGLVAKGDTLTGFAIAGEDRKFVWANARIDGDTVLVSSPQVAHPVAVRYGWAINPVCNLYNQEGLPASPFRTDDWPGITKTP